MVQCFQILLSNEPTCGRGVRYRMLRPTERDEVLYNSARMAGEKADSRKLAMVSSREGAKAMLVAVSRSGKLATLDGATWTKVDKEMLEMPGEFNYEGLFTAKDDEILCGLYQKLHGASQAEVDQIAGKAQPVSMD
jgi:hypothetical protein